MTLRRENATAKRALIAIGRVTKPITNRMFSLILAFALAAAVDGSAPASATTQPTTAPTTQATTIVITGSSGAEQTLGEVFGNTRMGKLFRGQQKVTLED